MSDKSGGERPVSEAEIREIVRDELGRGASGSTTRRGLLGAMGMMGLAGMAGCASKERPPRTDNSRSAGDSDPSAGNGDPSGGDSDPPTVARSGSGVENGGYLAQRGDVQSTLDDALEDGVGRVDLVSGSTYGIGSSIEVPPGIALNCSGAHIELQADVNAFELQTQSQVLNPQVRTSHIDGYSSSVFHVFPKQFDEPFGTNRPVPVWTVNGGWSEMTPGEGTCIEIHGARKNPSKEYDAGRDNRNVYFCFVAHNCIGGHRFAYLHREGGDTTRGGHVNGNIIRGFAQNSTRFVETDDTASGKNMVNGNKFHLATQPGEESEWLWYANKGEANELFEWGKNWDYARYSDDDGDGFAESWYIGPNAGANYVWRRQSDASGGLGSTIVDESGGSSGSRYILLDRIGIPVDELEVWGNAE